MFLLSSSPRAWCKFKLQWQVVVTRDVSDYTHGNARVAPRGILFLAWSMMFDMELK